MGRRCSTCDTVLSIYNKGPKCWVHAPARKLYASSRRNEQAGLDDLYELMTDVA